MSQDRCFSLYSSTSVLCTNTFGLSCSFACDGSCLNFNVHLCDVFIRTVFILDFNKRISCQVSLCSSSSVFITNRFLLTFERSLEEKVRDNMGRDGHTGVTWGEGVLLLMSPVIKKTRAFSMSSSTAVIGLLLFVFGEKGPNVTF